MTIETYQKTLRYLNDNFAKSVIKNSDMEMFELSINQVSIICLLKEILANDELAEKIAKRSYSHTLGFDKIVLMDLSKDIDSNLPKTQLRLHIWEPDNLSVPIVESLHEHSFDFISYVLTGKLENQVFVIDEMNQELNELLGKIKDIYRNASPEDKVFINDQLEVIEAIKLQRQGSVQLVELKMKEKYDLLKLMTLTGFTEGECFKLASIQGRYISDRVRGENKAYKHVFETNKQVYSNRVNHHGAGDYYFHSYVNPHRLYYDNSLINATMLVTTPNELNPQGGSFQRPTYIETEEINYDKVKINLEVFKIKLINLIGILEKSLTMTELLEDITGAEGDLVVAIEDVEYEAQCLSRAVADNIDVVYHTENLSDTTKQLADQHTYLAHLNDVKDKINKENL